MPEYFDPYHIWLGIPPEEQPTNLYRLLGIRAFETNPDAIESAADRQMARLRTLQSGKHALLSQRLFDEEMASVAVSLDGKPYLPPWQGELTSLSLPERWSLPNPRQPGLGAWKGHVTFHSARLRMLAGEALSEGN